jgi:CBS domain-containing protein
MMDEGSQEVDMDREEAPRRDIKLEDIMHPAVSVTPDVPAREVLKVLLENNVPGVPVVDEDGHLEGFISDGHLLDSAMPQYLKLMDNLSFVPESADKWVSYLTEAAEKPVREIMSCEVSQVELGKSEIAVAHKMIHDGVSSVVITRDGKVVGIVNRLDLYAAVVGLD